MIPIILSGGSGSRLWPLSREQKPKQFLGLVNDKTLFQDTLLRLQQIGASNPLIICNHEHRFIVEEQLAETNQAVDCLILEPFGRNTAPAVTLAAIKLCEEGRANELMLVLPADHVISNVNRFGSAVQKAAMAANQDELVLFGITPDKPETGYGYIQVSTHTNQALDGVLNLHKFVEKPDIDRANDFIRSGDYYWNSGMFMFKARRYLDEIQRHAPDIYDTCCLAFSNSVKENYITIDRESFEHCPDDSIDYAVMEKLENACVVPLSAGWSDIGSWSALWDVHDKNSEGNVEKGDVLAIESKNCFALSDGKLLTLLGVEDLVVIQTKDAILVANKNQVQDIKKVVNTLKQTERSEAFSHREVSRPWGSYDSVDNGHRFQVKRICVKPGASLSLQKHHHRAEHWIVVRGTAEVTCDDKVFLLAENQSTYLPIGAIHRLRNPGKVSLEIIEVQTGVYLGEDDIVRLEDVYGRSNNSQSLVKA